VEERFGLKPEHLAADTAANLDWLVNEKRIAPHIPVIDKSKRDDGRSRLKTATESWRLIGGPDAP